MKKRILIIGQVQFGSLVDTYQYCRHLGTDLDFTYLCWDYGNTMPTVEGTRVILVSRSGNKMKRLSRLLRRALAEINGSQYDLHVVVYFAGCGILGVLSRAVPTVLDIRTGYVRGGMIQTWFHNGLIAVEAMFFKHVSIITDGLRQRLQLPRSKCQVIPLGADAIEVQSKEFVDLRLLYVGTLQHRRIHETVRGFSMFCQRMGAAISATYEIVGSGYPSDIEILEATIAEGACKSRVKYFGRLAHAELRPFFSRNNVGVAYIPIVPEYQDQPSTKIFEYLLAGMAVVATDTKENRRLIKVQNGILCSDSPEGFCDALMELYRRRLDYDSGEIRSGTEHHTWARIARDQLLPYWQRLMKGRTTDSRGEIGMAP